MRTAKEQVQRAFNPLPQVETKSPSRAKGMENLQVGFNIIPDAAEVARQDQQFREIKSKDGRTMRQVYDDWLAGKD